MKDEIKNYRQNGKFKNCDEQNSYTMVLEHFTHREQINREIAEKKIGHETVERQYFETGTKVGKGDGDNH